ncbi:hypothetical protein FDI69_gp229 [Rhodococcus phage Trina]|uniref:VWFA domain-containing protein n=1 Tax=Rhodococcus phage Trina TaxID=2027905 RepID=A0A2D1AE37_9CAUD|nr:hypothetical protein FDI69_gp229 [Rhodococcus phage Trina]ASZ74957.1 hypothetical protein SEA_TRINA_165 [Rhodococcus phage Trina]
MTNPDLTLVGIVVDRSGSMSDIKKDMEGGIASILEQQKTLPGDTIVTLAEFDNHYNLVYGITPLAEIKPYSLEPRGVTALNDATAKFIIETGEALDKLPESERPGTVIIQIITDGMENASREWETSAVKNLIAKQKEKYGWEFIFMGSDLTTEKSARGYGIGAERTIRYAKEAVDCGANTSFGMTRNIRAAGYSIDPPTPASV